MHLLCAISGGGGLALYGTGNLHTWAESLDDVVARFTDARKIDRTLYMDDSAYRYEPGFKVQISFENVM